MNDAYQKFSIKSLADMQKEYLRRLSEFVNTSATDRIFDNIAGFNSELAELAQERKFFKYWYPEVKPGDKERQLEEYADALSFVLSVFIERERFFPQLIQQEYYYPIISPEDVTDQQLTFQYIELHAQSLHLAETMEYALMSFFENFLRFGAMLGFHLHEITSAYNTINEKRHQRLDELNQE